VTQYHEILEVQLESSLSEIKKAYRKLALLHYPDKGGDEEKFKEVTQAYEILSGKIKSPRNSEPDFGGGKVDFDFGNIRDILEQMGVGGFGRGSYYPGMGFRGAQRPPEHDSEVEVILNLDVAQIRAGGHYTLNYKLAEKCPDCRGKGGDNKAKCGDCHGTGHAEKVEKSMGNRIVMCIIPCNKCQGSGIIIINPCIECGTNGFVIKNNSVIFEVKEIK